MLIGLMGRLLAAHKGTVLAIVLLQLVQTTANLLLPTLNAAIIDDGIVGGNVPEILRLGSWMAAIALVQVVAAIAAGYLGAVVAMELGRQLREELFAKVQSMSSQEVGAFGAASLVTRATNDVAQIQNLRGPRVHDAGRRARHLRRRHRAGPAPGRRLVRHRGRGDSGARGHHGPDRPPPRPALPAGPGTHRPDQPDAAGADHRRQRHPRLCAPGARNPALRRGQQGPDAEQPAVRAAGRRDDAADHAGGQSVLCRCGLVRRAPDPVRRHAAGRTDGVHRLYPADPDRDHDGDVRLHDGPAGGSLRGTDPGGPRHGAGDHGRSGRRRARGPRRGSSGTSPSRTRAPRPRSSTASASRPFPGP